MIKVSIMAGDGRVAGTIDVEFGRFPCGERNIRIGKLKVPSEFLCDQLTISLDYQSDSDLIDLLLVTDALKRCPWINYTSLVLLIGYMPYGRQDRVSNPGEAHSLKVVASLINSCGFDKVFVVDPHSDVTEAVLDNFQSFEMADIVFTESNGIFEECDIYASPDAGAYKKVTKCAQIHGKPVVRCDKTRDTMTGALSGFEVYAEDLSGKHVMILDDICDGGGTFIGLANELRKKGAETISLYVTHGKFTKGVALLKESIDNIYCYKYSGPTKDSILVTEVDLYND
jgi:ribose-phosphate pyrophosphokinase